MTADLSALLDRLEAAAAAATPGEWYVARRIHVFSDARSQPGIGEQYMAADAALIVAAVNALPTLVAELRAHQAAVQAVREVADEMSHHRAVYPDRGDYADRIRAAVAALDPKATRKQQETPA